MTRAGLNRLAQEAAVFALCLGLAALFTRPLVAGFTSATLSGVDPMIDLYTVNWVSDHAFAPAQVFRGNVFYPSAHAVLYSDLSLGTAVLLVPLRLFIKDALPLYNAAVLIALGFGAWAFHALVHGLTGNLAVMVALLFVSLGPAAPIRCSSCSPSSRVSVGPRSP